MPGQKKRYNVRFPPARVKKIMQKDIEVGKMATAVPVIISRAIEMFLKSLLTKTCLITQSKHTRVMSVTHMKQCIESEKLFDFLKDIVERATTVSKKKEAKVKRKWPLYRNIRPVYSLQRNAKQKEAEEILKKPCNVSLECKNKRPECSLQINARLKEVEEIPKKHSNVSLYNNASSSDSDSPLYICL